MTGTGTLKGHLQGGRDHHDARRPGRSHGLPGTSGPRLRTVLGPHEHEHAMVAELQQHDQPPVHCHGLRTAGARRGRERRSTDADRRHDTRSADAEKSQPPSTRSTARSRLLVGPRVADAPRHRTLPVSLVHPVVPRVRAQELAGHSPDREQGGQTCRRTCRGVYVEKWSRAHAPWRAWARPWQLRGAGRVGPSTSRRLVSSWTSFAEHVRWCSSQAHYLARSVYGLR